MFNVTHGFSKYQWVRRVLMVMPWPKQTEYDFASLMQHFGHLQSCWLHRDVGDLQLVTSWYWWLTVDDSFRMLATELRSWYPTFMLRDRGCWWPKWPKPSPTSKNCHQHILSPTSVTNIDVACWMTGVGYE